MLGDEDHHHHDRLKEEEEEELSVSSFSIYLLSLLLV